MVHNKFLQDQCCSQRRPWHPTPVLLPGKSHGWRSLVGCSPWGHEQSDTTERLHFRFSLSCIGEGHGNPLQCSCLENPRDGGPSGLPSMESCRVGHDWSDLAAAAQQCCSSLEHQLYYCRPDTEGQAELQQCDRVCWGREASVNTHFSLVPPEVLSARNMDKRERSSPHKGWNSTLNQLNSRLG